jgi:hypothetical protein
VLRGRLPWLSHIVKVWTGKRWAPLMRDAQKKWRSSLRRWRSTCPSSFPWFSMRQRLRLLHLNQLLLLLRIPLLLRWRRFLLALLDDSLCCLFAVIKTLCSIVLSRVTSCKYFVPWFMTYVYSVFEVIFCFLVQLECEIEMPEVGSGPLPITINL